MSELAIPHERLVAVLERRLHAATSELAMKDAAIEELQERIGRLEARLAAVSAPAVAADRVVPAGAPASPA